MRSRGFYLIFLTFYMLYIQPSIAQTEGDDEVIVYPEENQKCLKCHGHKTYYYYNDVTEKEIKERMNPYFIIDSLLYFQANHRSFLCTDCHSMEFEQFPHPGELRMEEKLSCLDCHGGDEDFADFSFERVEEEFHESVHSTKHSDDFTCWMCHNPHSYKINARSNENIKETIQYDNDICLSCHANLDKYQLISSIANPNIITQHEWLPNQALHFLNVRCIECHAAIQDDIMIAHNIQTKDKAVKKCVECHSQNSLLLASLYKFQAKESRSKLGFVNSAILNNSYIIGANRNYYLNIVSLIIFGCVIAGIAFHGTLRILKK
ncbi:MAG: cytochrome c3 family protein [Bacteroidales bacterium]|nr:cytochrome c3 family protein [Bacteroidales bacterium]MCF8404732.1 cytochrome c3 family protein [Bacteroidales bacterium]